MTLSSLSLVSYSYLPDALLVTDVSRKRHHLAIDLRPVSPDHGLEFSDRASNDIDLGSIYSQGLCCHETDTRSPTRDQGDL
jgi:hypothetical protein